MCVHTCVRACVWMCAHACVNSWTCVCCGERKRVNVCVFVRAYVCVRVCVRARSDERTYALGLDTVSVLKLSKASLYNLFFDSFH